MWCRLRRRPAGIVGRYADFGSSLRRIFASAGRRRSVVYSASVTSQWELIVLVVVVVLLFGSKQVPSIARSLGRGVRDVRRTVADVDPREDLRRALDAPEDESRAARDD
jgi:sec-independent protein translocase protein TatA